MARKKQETEPRFVEDTFEGSLAHTHEEARAYVEGQIAMLRRDWIGREIVAVADASDLVVAIGSEFGDILCFGITSADHLDRVINLTLVRKWHAPKRAHRNTERDAAEIVWLSECACGRRGQETCRRKDDC
jgi:hypothetical protein